MLIKIQPLLRVLIVLAAFLLLLDVDRILVGSEILQTLIKGGIYTTFIFLTLFTYRLGVLRGANINVLLVAYTGACLFSIAWSYEPILTLIGIVSLIGTISAGLLCRQFLSIESTVRSFVFGAELILLFSFFMLLIGSDVEIFLQGVYRYVGVTFGPHALARASAVVFLYWFSLFLICGRELSHARLMYGLLIISLCVFSIIKSDSRQVLGAMLIACGVLYLLYLDRYKAIFVCVFSTLLVFIMTLVFYSGMLNFDLNLFARSDIDEILTFTGRIYIWESAVDLITNKFFFGYGFNAGGRVLESYYVTDFGWTTRSAHNLVLHVLLDVGLLGSLLLIGWFLVMMRDAFLNNKIYVLSVAVFVLIVGFVERMISGNVSFILFFLIVSSMSFTKKTMVK